MKLIPALGFLLFVSAIHAQDLPARPEPQKTNESGSSENAGSAGVSRDPTDKLIAEGTASGIYPSAFPDKVEPAPAHLGQWIDVGEPMGSFSDDLIITERKDDGRLLWHVEHVNSCAWCGKPLTWKQAAFDRKAFPLWTVTEAIHVADIEISHHAPCFLSGACREANPLLGQTRAQAYAVSSVLTALCWWGDAYIRKGDKSTHVGGYRYWWVVGPVVGTASSAFGIIANLARWNNR